MRTVTDVQAVPHLRGGRIDLTWTLPSEDAFAPARQLAAIKVVRRERTFPRNDRDGTVVYDGTPVSRVSDTGLTPGHRYYYGVYAVERDDAGVRTAALVDRRAQVAALATADFGSTARLYELLPGGYQLRDDALARRQLADAAIEDTALAAALAALPADIRGMGQLRRFLRAAAAPLDLMRSTAEALPDLHDPDLAPPEFLPLLAGWLGWDVDTTLAVHQQRNEIKFAPRLYRSVGTIDSLSRLVTRYTGWHTRVAEMEQALARSNQPPQGNLYATAQEGAEWLGADDACVALGFGPGNRSAAGSDGPPATAAELASPVSGTFALRPGMELTIEIDDRLPSTVRFDRGDFADIAAATADELAAALNRSLTQLTARVDKTTHRLTLASNRVGAGSRLRVIAGDASLISLDGAPRGRPAAVVDSAGRLRLVFAAADPLEAARTQTVRAGLRGEARVSGPAPGEAPVEGPGGRDVVVVEPRATDRLLVKTWVGGQWRASRPLTHRPVAQGEPALAPYRAGVLCAWVEPPGSPDARIRMGIGTPGAPLRAELAGTRTEPFSVEPGARLVFTGSWPGSEGVELDRAAFGGALDPHALTAAQVKALLAPHLVHVDVDVTPRHTVVFSSKAAGGDELIELDLAASTAAAALGFDASNATARGDWGDALSWSQVADIATIAPGRHADTFAVTAPGTDEVHLFWATHADAAWSVWTARLGTAGWTAPVQLAADAAGNREPCALLAPGVLVWSQLGRDNRWTLRYSTLAGGAWGPDAPVLADAHQPLAGAEGDREPALRALAGGGVRVVFRSDRSGGAQLWSTDLIPGGTGTAPVRLTSGAPHRSAPAPIDAPDGRLWLIHRSDANVALARVGTTTVTPRLNRVTQPEATSAPAPGVPRSSAADAAGARRRFAGSVTTTPRDAARVGRRREWDDLIAYSPQRTAYDPRHEREDDLYTRGTIGLHLSPEIAADPLTERTSARLRGALARFLPAHARAVVVLRPDVIAEEVYTPARDIGESFTDDYPFADAYPGAAESSAIALPDWTLFMSAPPAGPHRTANPLDLTTLRSRTWFPPPA